MTIFSVVDGFYQELHRSFDVCCLFVYADDFSFQIHHRCRVFLGLAEAGLPPGLNCILAENGLLTVVSARGSLLCSALVLSK